MVVDLSVRLGGLTLANPVMPASGTFGPELAQVFDLDRVPESHREEVASVRETLDRVGERNAHERCRRFMSAPLSLGFEQAKRHVEERSEDLAQTRP